MDLGESGKAPRKRYLGLLFLFLLSLCIIPLDRGIYEILLPISNSGIGTLYAHLTDLVGNGLFLVALVISLSLFFLKREKESLYPFIVCAALSMAATGIFCQVFKIVIGRPRPGMLMSLGIFEPFTLESDFHSCPSGHAAATFAMFWLLVRFVPKMSPLWLVLALGISLGRVIGQAHFLSDVFIGAIVGVFFSEILFSNRKDILLKLRGLFKR